MATQINGIQLRGFKSFNRPIQLQFGSGLNCIVGPNGSGKSNILDSLCFVLGRMSKKDLRTENYADLVFRGKDNKKKGESDIVFELCNKSKIFPVDSPIVEIVRKIKKDGSTQYKINKRNATRQQVLELMSHAKVRPNGHNIILQGDIHGFVGMSSNDKRKVIEEVAGISVYEERKHKTLKELEKVDGKIKEAEIVLTEKKVYLRGLESDKNTAAKYKNAKDELSKAKATEIRLRIGNAETKQKAFFKELERVDKLIVKLKDKRKKLDQKIGERRQEFYKLEKQIEKKGGEDQLTLQKDLESLKIELANNNNLIESSDKEINRILTRKVQLENNLKDIIKQIDDKTKTKSELKDKIKKAEMQITSMERQSGISGKGFDKLRDEIEKAEERLQGLKDKRDELRSKITMCNSESQIISMGLGDLSKRLEKATVLSNKFSKLGNAKTTYKKLLQEINKLSADDSKIVTQLSNLRKDILMNEEILAKERIHANSAQELLLRDRAISEILKMKKGKNSGVYGTVAELGKSSSRFDLALQVAAGARMRSVVVDNENTAIKCLNALKDAKAGVATLLPLSKLRSPPAIDQRILKEKGVIGLASELVSCDSKFNPVFKYVFGNTIVVDDSNIAKRLGVGRYRMVTLDGDSFDISGAITGGFRRKGMGIKFGHVEAKGNIDKLAAKLSDLKKNSDSLEKRREGITSRLNDLRISKAELEGQINSVESLGALDPSEIKKEILELEAKNKLLAKDKSSSENKISELEDKIAKGTVNLNAFRLQLNKKQFGGNTKQLDNLNKEKIELTGTLIAIETTLENALIPERDNIQRVVKILDKEEKEFKNQISAKKNGLSKLEKQIAEKESESKQFYGRLKELFAKKNKISDEIKDIDVEDSRAEEKISEFTTAKNNSAINKAKFEAELAALTEELEEYKKAKTLNINRVDEARLKVKELERIINRFGNVNMRALEVYEEIKKEYDDLTWKVGKLSAEKDDIMSVIDEIETRKKDSFGTTYKKVKENFENIFRKITAKDNHAQLILEDEKNPFNGGLVVRIKDKDGKKITLASLSGGEKVLVALSFIFAIQEFSPAPFYLLDEIDAALDKVNSEKVASLLRDYSKKAQLIIISHNDSIISAADRLHGVSMNKHGESNIVSLKI